VIQRRPMRSGEERGVINLLGAAPRTIIPPTMKSARRKRDFGLLCAVILLFAEHPGACEANSQSEQVRARIVAEVQSIRPGSPFWLGVHFDIEEGWHLNWVNPGDAGLAPSIRWRLPEGFKVNELVWPYPRLYRIGPLAIYGYDTTLLLMARVIPPQQLPAGKRIRIGADVDWLACAEACVPGKAELVLELPVSDATPRLDERWRAAFERARLNEPMPSAGWRVRAFVEDERRYVLEVRSSSPEETAITGCLFFPFASDVIEHAGPQEFSAHYGGFDLVLQRARMSTEIPDRIAGVLVAQPGWDRSGKRRAISIDVPLEAR
jgi:DsbC/DsbD-like thiol-disulfide interchange protein